jgi:hypothetical protein
MLVGVSALCALAARFSAVAADSAREESAPAAIAA